MVGELDEHWDAIWTNRHPTRVIEDSKCTINIATGNLPDKLSH